MQKNFIFTKFGVHLEKIDAISISPIKLEIYCINTTNGITNWQTGLQGSFQKVDPTGLNSEFHFGKIWSSWSCFWCW